MRCPSLKELPPPPPGRKGWPWTEESPPLPDLMSDGSPWPRVSIVTPSYNQGRFIEETIRSILLQGYPNLQYLIIDGGSNDETPEIIRRYEPWIDYWISEPDHGQAHAINKGFSLINGSLVNWINSDDQLLPGSLGMLARVHHEDPTAILAGGVEEFEVRQTRGAERKEVTIGLVQQSGLEFRNFVEFWKNELRWHQPGVFIPATLLAQVGPLDESLRYGFDHDLMCRLLQVARVRILTSPIARFRRHPESKTGAKGHLFLLEVSQVSRRYWNLVPASDRLGHDRFVSDLLFRRGVRRFQRGDWEGLSLIWQAIRLDPISAISSVPKRLLLRVKRQL